ncbi:hypothetical protein [Actinoallomurus sp. NPDC050550]|uniref:hypothetical protein n=1 Tax=Actinoallomurus sp. NPDC050550 TaxID=3154937 RepID=UPI0033EAA62F
MTVDTDLLREALAASPAGTTAPRAADGAYGADGSGRGVAGVGQRGVADRT